MSPREQVAMRFLAKVRRHVLAVGVEPLGARQVRLSYTATDPYAVTLEVADRPWRWGQPKDADSSGWTFARQLLAEGIDRGVGQGRVHVCPAPHEPGRRVAILLRTAPGVGYELLLRRAEIDAALDRMAALVPLGAEGQRIDWPRELAALVGGESR